MGAAHATLHYSSGSDIDGQSSFSIIDSSFINNDYIKIPNYGTHFNGLCFDASHMMLSMKNVTISNNTGWYDTVLLLSGGDDRANELNFLFEDSIVADNTLYVSENYKRGTVQLDNVGNITIHGCSFVNNSATGLLVKSGNIYFGGKNIVSGNRGYDGGGMALYLSSTLSLTENATVLFEDNVAENKGGGIYVQHDVRNSYTMHAKAASVLSARAQGRSPRARADKN